MTILPWWVRLLIFGALMALLIGTLKSCHDQLFERGRVAGVAQEKALWDRDTIARNQREAAARAAMDKQREESDRETRRLNQLAQEGRAAADAAAGKLRRDLAAFVAAHRADSAAVSQRPATDDPIGVLADVLGRADKRAGVLAAYADSAHIAGAQCERDYDALRAANVPSLPSALAPQVPSP